MKTIVCTGNSHTWGQGASGIMEDFDPPAIAGDLRWVNLDSDCYVNILRKYINNKTGSVAKQHRSGDLKSLNLPGDFELDINIVMREGKIPFRSDADFVRLQFCSWSASGDTRVITDSILTDPDNRTNSITAEAENVKAGNYTLELYSGSHAVINSGVGSCTAGRFLSEYWDSHVKRYFPEIVLIEGHSINDWLNNVKLNEYMNDLQNLFEKTREIGAEPILLTVSPILGNQISDSGIDYRDYIEASREAAVRSGVSIADANQRISKAYENMDHTTRHLEMFTDIWHVSDLGHRLYAETIKEIIN